MSDKTTPTIGKILTEEMQRDAVHFAVAPVIAGEGMLMPGMHIGINADGTAGSLCKLIGIVDPFLKGQVNRGERFWMFLYPQTITSLRHEWTHPAFGKENIPTPTISDHEIWLRAYAMRMNRYDKPQEAFARLIEGLKSGELYAYGSDLHSFGDLDDASDLRMHAEAFLGIRINWEDFQFTCSC